jgi:hypothetical protein
MKDNLHGHHALCKLVSFKGHNLDRPDPSPHLPHSSFHARLRPTEHVAYYDLAACNPAFMTCCEMLTFSILFIWAFGPSPTKQDDKAARTSAQLAKRSSTSSTLSTSCRVSLLCSKPCYASHLGSDLATRRKTCSLGTR